jgi:hypothetical protein
MGQTSEPLAHQDVDLLGAEPVGQGLGSGWIGTGGDAIVQGLEGDAGMAELALEELVAVETELGVVGEVAAELEKERPEVAVADIKVPLVDHGGGADNPGVGGAVVGAASLGAEDADLFLGLADEDDAVLDLGGGKETLGEVILALVLLEGDERNTVRLGEILKPADEILGHRIHQGGGGEAVAAMEAPEVGDGLVGLEPGDVEVEVHPVDALEFEGDVFVEDLGDGAWYGHGGLRWWTPGHFDGPPTARGQNNTDLRIRPRLCRRGPLATRRGGAEGEKTTRLCLGPTRVRSLRSTSPTKPRRSEAEPR